jgi:NADP-dependent 3-hydroxy acid dehydrogenase YdfG
MSKTILICGYGAGISDAVARKFGAQGYSVALVARNAEKLNAAAQSLTQSGIKAKAFALDLGDVKAVRALVADAHNALGPIGVIHWNAYSFHAGDLTTATEDEFRSAIDVSVTGLISATQAALADLKEQKGAVLVTGGGLCSYDPNVDLMATQWNAMGLAVAKAAQHKLAGVLAAKLKGDDIYVGEVVVMGAVKGTPFDRGNATIEAADIAQKFWDLTQSRTTLTVNFPG